MDFFENNKKLAVFWGIGAVVALAVLLVTGSLLFRQNKQEVKDAINQANTNVAPAEEGISQNELSAANQFFDALNAPKTSTENGLPKISGALPPENNQGVGNQIRGTLAPPLLLPPPPPPPPVSMDRVKKQGCVADGLLTGYSPENNRFIDLINRSNCYYLHRAIETWLTPPDFGKVESRKNRITKKDVVYGMFLAEAIDTKAVYYNEKKQRNFDFSEMCRKGSDNFWGEHTCQPAFSSVEYRDYLKQTTQTAIDLGIQSFTFGQIYWQEGTENKYAQEIVRDIRAYAKESGMDVVVGAQTGAISDPKYLKIFDYIEGGVGINSDGVVENGPCLSRRGSCWALLWNKNYAGNANNVLLHLDWTGVTYDDLDIFARMSLAKRAQTLRDLYAYFASKNIGFMMPYFGVLDKNNGGCYGPAKKYYSPDNAYSCRDEDVINQILSGGK